MAFRSVLAGIKKAAWVAARKVGRLRVTISATEGIASERLQPIRQTTLFHIYESEILLCFSHP